MKMHVMASTLLIALSIAVMAECAGSPLPQKQKLPVPSATAPVKAGVVKTVDPFTGMEFVFVKGGCFLMGDEIGDGNTDEKPVHEVCVADYYLGKFEVTQAQWQKVMGTNPSSRKECGPDCPVESVSWNMVQEFIAKLNSKGTSLYRLPTEAEWEYAARSGGKKEKWAGVNSVATVGEFAWLGSNSDSAMHKVGLKKSNSLGLYDMSGNAMEWCQDWYAEDYYAGSPKDNPSGPSTGQQRVVRGGDFGREANELRTTHRKKDDVDILDGTYGFRLVRSAK